MIDQDHAAVVRRWFEIITDYWRLSDDEKAAFERAIELLEREGVHDWERDPW